MPIGGILGGLGSAIGGIFGASASSDAAKAQSKELNRAIDLQQAEFQQTTQNMLPFLQLGTTGANVLANNYFGVSPTGTFNPNAPFIQPISSVVGAPPSPTDPSLLNQFQQSPGYQYQLQQMMNAVQNSSAGRNGAISGNMMRSLQSNAGGLANQDYWTFYNALLGNYGNRYQDISNQRNMITGTLSNIAGAGQSAAANQGQLGQQAVSNIGGLLGTLGSAQAAGILGGSNALSSGFSGLFNSLTGGGGNGGINYLLGGGGGSGGGGGYFDTSVNSFVNDPLGAANVSY